jgi:hypothetical protein
MKNVEADGRNCNGGRALMEKYEIVFSRARPLIKIMLALFTRVLR